MTDASEDRRSSQRLNLRFYGQLQTADASYSAHLVNLSENGALVALLDEPQLSVAEPVSLIVELAAGQRLALEGHIAHWRAHLVGLDCTPATDADAIAAQGVIAQLDAQKYPAPGF